MENRWPFSTKQNSMGLPNFMPKTEIQNQRQQLSGFYFVFPSRHCLTLFPEQAVACGTESAAEPTELQDSWLCVLLATFLQSKGKHDWKVRRNLLIAPGPRPLHFTPWVSESDQLLWGATEIHLQVPNTEKEQNCRAPAALLSCPRPRAETMHIKCFKCL